jgi:E3 ubiquitin-protein ligase EDD1
VLVERRLKPTWDWLLTVMDSTEAQLRFGAALSQASGKGNNSSSESQSQRHGSGRHGRNRDLRNSGSRDRHGGSRFATAPAAAGPGDNRRELQLRSNLRRALRLGTGGGAEGSGGGPSSRRDFVNYMLSLMRSHSDEHLDSLPSVDVAALKHVAYVFDALMYYMRSASETSLDAFELPAARFTAVRLNQFQ